MCVWWIWCGFVAVAVRCGCDVCNDGHGAVFNMVDVVCVMMDMVRCLIWWMWCV